MISVPLWLTSDQACGYLNNKIARSAVVDTNFPMDSVFYAQLLEQGFRRSGDAVYKPHCTDCSACISTRIAVKEFQPDRKQKRCLNRNRNIQIHVRPPVFLDTHFDLYLRYQAARHDNDKTTSVHTENDYMQFLGSSWCNTQFVEFFIADKLMAVAIIDILDNALSAVYTFFDPELSNHSPGVYAILWQIEQAKKLNFEYIYPGFWIKDCKKMCYKNQYQPLQGLINQQWLPILNHS